MKRINHNTQTATARRTLKPRREPYWTNLGDGLSLGYYKMERDGTWSVRRRLGSKYTFQSLGDADDQGVKNGLSYSEAASRCMSKEMKIASGTNRHTVQSAIDSYLKSKRAATAEIHLTDHPLSSIKLDDLTPSDVRGWLDDLVTATKDKERRRQYQATANRRRTSLFAALNFAVKHEMTENIRFRIVKPFPKVEAHVFRFLSVKEATAFLGACVPGQLRDLCEAALVTGGRLEELVALRVKDFTEGHLVALFSNKTNSVRTVGLNDQGKALFKRCTQGKKPSDLIFPNDHGEAWKKNQHYKPVLRAWQRAKIEPVRFKDLRITYGSLLARAKVPLLNISKAMGHADTRVTERYYTHLVEQEQHAITAAALPDMSV